MAMSTKSSSPRVGWPFRTRFSGNPVARLGFWVVASPWCIKFTGARTNNCRNPRPWILWEITDFESIWVGVFAVGASWTMSNELCLGKPRQGPIKIEWPPHQQCSWKYGWPSTSKPCLCRYYLSSKGTLTCLVAQWQYFNYVLLSSPGTRTGENRQAGHQGSRINVGMVALTVVWLLEIFQRKLHSRNSSMTLLLCNCRPRLQCIQSWIPLLKTPVGRQLRGNWIFTLLAICIGLLSLWEMETRSTNMHNALIQIAGNIVQHRALQRTSWESTREIHARTLHSLLFRKLWVGGKQNARVPSFGEEATRLIEAACGYRLCLQTFRKS